MEMSGWLLKEEETKFYLSSILRQFPRAFFFSLKKKGGKLLKGFQTPFSFFFLLIWLILLKEKKFLGIKKKKGTRTTIGRLCIFYYFFSF
jgi:hypothetical protein